MIFCSTVKESFDYGEMFSTFMEWYFYYMLKKHLFLLLIPYILLLVTFQVDLESKSYLLIESETYFYSSPSFDESSKLFIVPKDFYVELISEFDGYYKVSYQSTSNGYIKLIGHVKAGDLSKESGRYPLYPDIEVTALKNTTLFEDKTLKVPITTILSGQSVFIYGATDDPTVAFCVFENETGYISTSSFESFEIPSHPINTEKQEEISQETEKIDEKDTFSENILPSSIQTLLFIFIAIPVLLLTFLLFSIKRKEK